MYPIERYERIMKILEERQSASVHYLAKALFVSEPTLRRDLAVLEQEGRLRRTHGGAVLDEMINCQIPLSLRERSHVEEKEALARMALPYLRSGQSLFLDASSTVSHVIPLLSRFEGLTVITNSPKASLKLAEMKIRCLCTGGHLLENSIAYVGHHAEEFVKKFNVDLFLFSCRGLSADGRLTDSSEEESLLRQAMLAHAKESVCLCTSDKLGQEYLFHLTTEQEITKILTTVPRP